MNSKEYKIFLESFKSYKHSLEQKSFSNIDLKLNFENYMKSVKKFSPLNFKTDKELKKWTLFTRRHRSEIFKYQKIRKHPDHSDFMVKELSYQAYYLFKIVDQIWKKEKIEKEDLKMIPNFFWIYLYQIIKPKFSIEMNLSSVDDFFNQISSLRLNFNKRKEEILKFILKRFLKQIFLMKIFEKNINYIEILHKKFFEHQIKFKYFVKLFVNKENNKNPPIIKSYNFFAKLVTENKSLKILFLEFLTNLSENHKKEITKKLFSNFKIINNYFKDKSKFMKNYQNSLKMVERRRFVGPWTLEEVEISIKFIHENFINK